MGSNHPAAVFTARFNHLSYIATLFMNHGGAQPPTAKVGIEPTLMSDFLSRTPHYSSNELICM